MRVYLLDVKNSDNSGVRDLFGDAETDAGIDNSYIVYRDLIGCDFIDITTRSLCGMIYDFIVDDEGQLYDNPKPSAITSSMETALYGSVIITRSTHNGNQSGLTDEDIKHIQDNIGWMAEPNGLYNILMRVDL